MRRITSIGILICFFISLIGCASSTYRPVVYPKDNSYSQPQPQPQSNTSGSYSQPQPQPQSNTSGSGNYESDLEECRIYAKQISPGEKGVKEGAVGAAVGAVGGLLIGSMFGEAGKGAAVGAGVGAVTGGAHGAWQANEEQKKYIVECMRRKGHDVRY